MRRYIALVCCPALILACAAQLAITPVAAQDVFNSRAAPEEGNPNCPPPVINGITPKNWSCKTGPQYTEGNPNCPPPTIIINGQTTTPRNWSCPGGTTATRNAPNGPWDPNHPGFPTVAGSTPCQPGGPGGYNYLDNPVGTRLPPGCVRPTRKTVAKTDSQYEARPPGGYLVPPVKPPGSYIQPEGKPGSYIVPPHGAPGSYLQPDGQPGSYLDSTAKSEPGESNTRTHAGSGDATGRSSGTNRNANDGLGRRDTGKMRGVVSNGNDPSYRQDTSAPPPGTILGGVNTNGITARKTTPAKKPNTDADNAAANSQATTIVKTIMNLFGGGP